MRLRNSLIMFGVALIMGLFVLIFEQLVDSTAAVSVSSRRLVPKLKDELKNVDAIEINRGAAKIVLVKRHAGTRQEHWRIGFPVDYRADASRIISFLNAFATTDKVPLAEDKYSIELNPADDVSQYGLSKPISVSIFAGGKTLCRVRVGAKVGSDQVYVASSNLLEVYLVPEIIHEEALRFVDEFRDKFLLNTKLAKLTELSLEKADNTGYSLETDKTGRWLITEPFEDRASGKGITALSESLANIQADKFVYDFAPEEPTREAKLAQYGLAPCEFSIKVKYELHGVTKEEKLLFGKRVAKHETGVGSTYSVYTIREGTNTVLLVPEASLGAFKVSVGTLRERKLVDINIEQTNKITVSRAGGDIALLRVDDENWSLKQGENSRAADKLVIGALLKKLSDTKVANFLPEATEISTPNVVLQIAQAADASDKPITEALIIGHVGEQVVARRKFIGSACALEDDTLLKELLAEPTHFYDRKILGFKPSRLMKIDYALKNTQLSAVKFQDGWRVKGSGQIDQLKTQKLKWRMSMLRAKKVVTTLASADPSAYGLAPAEIKINLRLEERAKYGSEEFTLLVGSELPDIEGRYAMLKGRDVIYLLDKDATKDIVAGIDKEDSTPPTTE